jgi:hypothetical protein
VNAERPSDCAQSEEALDCRALKALRDPEKKPEDLKTEVERLLRVVYDKLSPLWGVEKQTADQKLLDRVRLYLLLALSDMEKPDQHGKRWLVVADDTTDPACEDALLLPSVLADGPSEACAAAEHRYHVTHDIPGVRVMAAWDAEWMVGLAATMLTEAPSFVAVNGPDGKITSRDPLPEEGGDDDE